MCASVGPRPPRPTLLSSNSKRDAYRKSPICTAGSRCAPHHATRRTAPGDRIRVPPMIPTERRADQWSNGRYSRYGVSCPLLQFKKRLNAFRSLLPPRGATTSAHEKQRYGTSMQLHRPVSGDQSSTRKRRRTSTVTSEEDGIANSKLSQVARGMVAALGEDVGFCRRQKKKIYDRASG